MNTHFSRLVVLSRGIVAACCAIAAQAGLPAASGQVYEAANLTASDGAPLANFGGSVSISGDFALVGAFLDGIAGSAYVYTRQPNGAWLQEPKLTASDGAQSDFFGYSVSVSGEFALIGAYGVDKDEVELNSGAAYVFRREPNGAWIEEAKLMASDAMAFRFFGVSVSISDGLALIGAIEPDGVRSGSAYVFRRDPSGAWSEEAKLTASDGEAGDWFGFSVSLAGDLAVIGALRHDDSGMDSGAAYAYRREPSGAWTEEAKLTASDAAPGDSFGASVSISGERALIGAYLNGDAGSSSGSAYVFNRGPDGEWSEETKLTASDAAENDQFGLAASISGSLAVVGSPRGDDAGPDSGSVYVFRRDPSGAWSEQAKVVSSDADAGDLFGSAVSVLGDRALLGAYANTVAGSNSGSAYVFDLIRVAGVTGDCNGNGVNDLIDLLQGTVSDCNDNLIPDSCDIASGFSLDLNGDGVPDECQTQSACVADLTGDGQVTASDLALLLGSWGVCP